MRRKQSRELTSGEQGLRTQPAPSNREVPVLWRCPLCVAALGALKPDRTCCHRLGASNSRWRATFMLEQVMNEPIRHCFLAIEMIDLSALRPYAKNARRHSRAQIKQIAKSIEAFGFTNPILVSDELEILAGHGRAAAAQLIGMKQRRSFVCRTSALRRERLMS